MRRIPFLRFLPVLRGPAILACAVLAVFAACAAVPARAADAVKVVASIPDIAAIAKAVGGDAVETESIVKGNRDVHAVELLPSLMLKVRRADIYLKVGLDLDLWAQNLIDGSRNARLRVVDLGHAIAPLEVPNFKVDASYGDLHRFGNPHYWLDPANARPLALAIAEALGQQQPARAAEFRAGAETYAARMDEAVARWKQQLAPYKGAALISYHNSWPYFAQRFDLRMVEFLEPKPGIPPTPSHIADLEALLRKGDVKAILMESYFDDRVPVMLARTTGVPLVKVPVLVGADKDVPDQFALFDRVVGDLARALGSRK